MNHYDLVVCEPSLSRKKMQKINGTGLVKLENVNHVLIKKHELGESYVKGATRRGRLI